MKKLRYYSEPVVEINHNINISAIGFISVDFGGIVFLTKGDLKG